MRKARKLVPVFYTRGLNAPYTEGHIQIVNTITKSLLLYGIKSLVFNFKYHTGTSRTKDDFASRFQVEQAVPFVDRDEAISARSWPIFAYSLIMETLRMPKFLLFERALKHRNYIVNIVNCFRYPRIFVKKMFRVPVVLHFYMPHLRGRYMLRLLTNKADLIIASSHEVARYLEEYDVSKKKIAIVYPPVDTTLYKPASRHVVRRKLGLPEKGKIILYIGSLKPTRFPEDKVLGVLEDLAKAVPETLLLIFTPKSNLNIRRALEIRKKAKVLNLVDRVKIHVKDLSEKEKADIYAVADIFFFPQSGPRAAVDPPPTVLEAMASGRVVFAPKLSSASEIITDNKNGFLFEQRDNNALARRFADLLVNERLKNRVSHCARQDVEQRLSLLAVGERMLEHFVALSSGQRR